MANPTLQGEVQQQLHACEILPTHQEEIALEKSFGETSKRGLSMAREGENPYQEFWNFLVENSQPSRRRGHASHEEPPSKEKERSKSPDNSMEDVAPRRHRVQISPTPTKRKRSPHSPLANQRGKRSSQRRKRRERGHPLLHLHHLPPLWMKVVVFPQRNQQGEDIEDLMLLREVLDWLAVQVQVYWSAVQDYWLLDWSVQVQVYFRITGYWTGLVSCCLVLVLDWLAVQVQVYWSAVQDYWTGLVSCCLVLVQVQVYFRITGYWTGLVSCCLVLVLDWLAVQVYWSAVQDYWTSLVSCCLVLVQWDHIEQLAREKNLDELEWLIRLLTTSDPYPIEDMHPIAQIYPLAQVDYTRLVRFLVLLCEEDDEDIEDDWTDMSHGMTDNDFIYLDDEDRGLALGLPPNLYNILFP
ncbi:hypothetical protein L7F22_033779 [Adiantum nelumboides]|nr:hypothetical protein [Adiantum nelumboides]